MDQGIAAEQPRAAPVIDDRQQSVDHDTSSSAGTLDGATQRSIAGSEPGHPCKPPQPGGLLHARLADELPRLGIRGSAREAAADGFALAAHGRRAPVDSSGLGTTRPADGRPPPPSLADAVKRMAAVANRRHGRPLPPNLRHRLEAELGASLASVRVHHDPTTTAALSRLGARAATLGNAIIVSQPGLIDDEQLMAHEAVHTVQQRQGAPILQRDDGAPAGPVPVAPDYPPLARLVIADLDTVLLQPVGGDAILTADVPPGVHFIAILVKALAGDSYQPSLVDEIVDQLGRKATVFAGATRVHREGDEALDGALVFDKPIAIPVAITGAVVNIITRQLDPGGQHDPSEVLAIDRAQVERLQVGLFAHAVAAPLRSTLDNYDFPAWYTTDILLGQLNTMAGTLHETMLARDAAANETERLAAEDALVEAVYDRVYPLVIALDEIRICEPLFPDPDFRRFWRLDPAGTDGPARDQKPVVGRALSFFAYAVTQRPFVESLNNGSLETAGVDGDNRVELWRRFNSYLGRERTTSPAARGDLILEDADTDRTDPPFPSSITHVPPLSDQTEYEASQDAVHRFVMDVEFGDLFDHLSHTFGGFDYLFEVLRVPTDAVDESEAALSSTELGQGDQPSYFDVLTHELGREARDTQADYRTLKGTRAADDSERAVVDRIIESLVVQLGPPGTGADTVFAANTILRFTLRVVKTLLSGVTQDQGETDVEFGSRELGLYLIRGSCDPVLDPNAPLRRATSVAWTPIWVRTPDAMARSGVERMVDQRALLGALLADIDRDLAGELDDAERDQLIVQREIVAAARSGEAGAQLDARIANYQQAFNNNPGLSSADASAIQRQIDRMSGVRERRTERLGGRASETLAAHFVAANGATFVPLIEVDRVDSDFRSDTYRAYELSSGNDPRGTGTDSHTDPVLRRRRAITAALREAFETYDAFGRGQLGVFIPNEAGGEQGELVSLRIERDRPAIAMDMIENVTDAIAVAALAAAVAGAPVTGGASLVFMAAVGVVGGIPAGYRLIDKLTARTLEFDSLDTWLDVADVLGAVAGPFGAAAKIGVRTGIRAKKLMGGMAILGIGADNLGLVLINVHTIDQIETIQREPGTDSQKRAKIVEVLAGVLKANGMAVGQTLADHANRATLPDGPTPSPASAVPLRADADTTAAPRRGDADPPTTPTTGRPTPHADGGPPPDPTTGVAPRGHGAPAPSREASTATADTTVATPSPDGAPRAASSQEPPQQRLGGIVVRTDPNDTSNSVKVFYTLDKRRLVETIEVVRGQAASADLVQAHARSIEYLQRYQGLAGRVRLALDRVLRLVDLAGEPPPGSLVFEARGEIIKLGDVTTLRIRELASAIERGDMAGARDVAADIANIREQIDFYESMLDAGVTADGRGYIAALDANAFTQMRQQIGDRAMARVAPSRRRGRRSARDDRARAERIRADLDTALQRIGEVQGDAMTATDALAIGEHLAAPSDPATGTISATEMGRRVARLQNLAELLQTRPEYADPATQQRLVGNMRALFANLEDQYRDGRTNERVPRRVARLPEIDEKFDQIRDMIDDLRPGETTPVDFLLRLDDVRRRIVNVQERLRALGEARFEAEPERVLGRRQATQPGLEHLEVEEVELTASGIVDEPLDRSLSEVGLERYVPAARELDRIGIQPPELGARLRELLDNFDRAHLIGPGFGSELFAGIWYAPADFNRKTQNRGIEMLIRTMKAAGWEVELTVTARGDRMKIPTVDGIETITILREITYALRWSTHGAEFQPRGPRSATVRYHLPEPPATEVNITAIGLPASLLGPDGIASDLLEAAGLIPPGGFDGGRNSRPHDDEGPRR